MAAPSPHEVTQLLLACNAGEETALEKLIPLVYADLPRVADRYMDREHHGYSLQTTALFSEAYLRLIDARNVRWQNRAHFLRHLRTIDAANLVHFARLRNLVKRGGGARKVSFNEALLVSKEQGQDLVGLHDTVMTLAATDPE